MNKDILKILNQVKKEIKECRDNNEFYGSDYEYGKYKGCDNCLDIVEDIIKEYNK